MKTIIATLLLMLCASAHARLGETVNECTRRYGEPVKVDKEGMVAGFRKEGILIRCVFFEGVCSSVSFFKEDRGKFSEVEFEALREANLGNASPWEKRKNIVFDQEWWSTPGAEVRHAILGSFNELIVIQTEAQFQREQAAKAAQEKAKLQGF